IEQSRGELLALLDADDYWLPTFLERQVSLYDSGQAEFGNVGIVACNASLVHASNGPRPETYMELARFPHEVTLHRLLEHNPIFSSVVTPRRVVDEAGGFFPELFRTQDFDLWIRIVEAGYRVVATREVLAVHRVGLPSLSSDVAAMAHYSQKTYNRAL